MGHLSRRQFVTGALGLITVGCSANVDQTAPAPVPTTPPTPRPTPTSTPTPAPTATPQPTPTPEPTPTPQPTATPEPTPTPDPADQVQLANDPFRVGVASGDALSSAVVLWTRLIVTSSERPGVDVPIPVRVQLSASARFETLLLDEIVQAEARYGYSLHVDATQLDPGTDYWYRFSVGGYSSQIGHTRTLPVGETERFAFALATCQGYQFGEYPAWRDVAGQGGLNVLDAVVFTGDYIYEHAPEDFSPEGSGRRAWAGPSPRSLDDFRVRYAQTKSDPNLQAAHAALPWFVIWDDHEITDNYWADGVGQFDPAGGEFLPRRAAAYQAWWEHMPVRSTAPTDGNLQVYRTVDLGSLGTMFLTDTRQYADRPPCRELSQFDYAAACSDAFTESRQLLGVAQEQWLLDAIPNSTGLWSVLVTPVMFSGLEAAAASDTGEPIRYLESWDGYVAARQRVANALRQTESPLILSGDYHASMVLDSGPGFGEAALCPEIMSPAISSNPLGRVITVNNQHLRYLQRVNGYVMITLDRRGMQAEFREVADLWNPQSAVRTSAKFAMAPGATTAAQTA